MSPPLDPPLEDLEDTLRRTLQALRVAQAHHQFHDPDAPALDTSAIDADDEDAFERALAAHQESTRRYREAAGPRAPRDALELSPLWDLLAANRDLFQDYRVPALEPLRRCGEDLYFEPFALSQRRVAETRSPHGWLPRAYFLAVPPGERAFRCIVVEVSGRSFCTTEARQHCAVPREDDFGVVRLSGTGANDATGARRPVIMHLYLPAQYGPWQRLAGPYGEGDDEQIVGYGEAPGS